MRLFDVDLRELMLTLGKDFFYFWEVVWVSRLAVVWTFKPWNYLEEKCLFLHGSGFVWGWSDFVPSNFDFFCI